jgi:hypothetical protein
MLQGHAGAVECLAVLKLPDVELLVSGSADNTLRVWQKRASDPGTLTTQKAQTKNKPNFLKKKNELVVNLFYFPNPKAFSCVQTMSFGSGFVLSVALALLPGSTCKSGNNKHSMMMMMIP